MRPVGSGTPRSSNGDATPGKTTNGQIQAQEEAGLSAFDAFDAFDALASGRS